jgi:hypothetical protein
MTRISETRQLAVFVQLVPLIEAYFFGFGPHRIGVPPKAIIECL